MNYADVRHKPASALFFWKPPNTMSLEPNSIANGLLLAFAMIALALPRNSPRPAFSGNSADHGTSLVLVGCYCITVLVLNTSTFPVLPLPLPHWWAWCGLLVGVSGLALYSWATLELRRFHLRTITPGERQQIIRSGPYRVIRHPRYLGSLALWSGATAASGNLVALFTVSVAMLAAYAVRISIEEAMLGNSLGTAYDVYRRRSWRLIPFVY